MDPNCADEKIVPFLHAPMRTFELEKVMDLFVIRLVRLIQDIKSKSECPGRDICDSGPCSSVDYQSCGPPPRDGRDYSIGASCFFFPVQKEATEV